MRETAVLVTLACLTSACAFTDVPLTLPTRGLDPTIPGGRGRQVIVVVPFSDARQIRQRCGMQKNGYNMDTADAICQSDPNAWFAQLLADELRASGFSVLDDEAEHRPTALRIEGSLIKIFVEPVIGFWSGSLEADLSVKLRVTTQTGLEAERTFFVKGWKGGAQVLHVAGLPDRVAARDGGDPRRDGERDPRADGPLSAAGTAQHAGSRAGAARGGVAMKGLALGITCLLLPILGGCARHFVVERSAGRIDGERSISTNSDTGWTVRHEPAAPPSAGHSAVYRNVLSKSRAAPLRAEAAKQLGELLADDEESVLGPEHRHEPRESGRQASRPQSVGEDLRCATAGREGWKRIGRAGPGQGLPARPGRDQDHPVAVG